MCPDRLSAPVQLETSGDPLLRQYLMLGIALIIVLFVVGIAVFPVWPYSRKWGYWPVMVVYIGMLLVLLFGLTGIID
jgi:drug/metabolite transporter (DMT)-like permease